jgi:hypothetical protein
MQYQVNCTLEHKGGRHDWNADYMNGGQVALRGKLRWRQRCAEGICAGSGAVF